LDFAETGLIFAMGSNTASAQQRARSIFQDSAELRARRRKGRRRPGAEPERPIPRRAIGQQTRMSFTVRECQALEMNAHRVRSLPPVNQKHVRFPGSLERAR
jgi:hypothetical protein